jgi:hypothetical protein
VRFEFSTEANVRLIRLAIGILMTEMLLDGHASTMDIQALSLDRFAAGRWRAEANMF